MWLGWWFWGYCVRSNRSAAGDGHDQWDWKTDLKDAREPARQRLLQRDDGAGAAHIPRGFGFGFGFGSGAGVSVGQGLHQAVRGQRGAELLVGVALCVVVGMME